MKTEAPVGVFASIRATPPAVRYLLGGVLINQMGAFAQTFLVLYLAFRGFSLGQAGIALTAYSVGAIFGTMLGAELTHRFGPRSTIVGAMTTSAAILGFVPWLADPGRLVGLLLAIGLAGLATQAYRPAAAVLLSDLMPEEHRVMAFSMMRIALNFGAVTAPLIAAGLILVDWDLLFWFDAATALTYAVLAFALLPNLPTPKQAADPHEDKRSAYVVLLRDWRYLLFLASALLGTVIYVQYIVALPLKITADGHPTSLYSAVLVTTSLVLVCCELKITTYVKDRHPHAVAALGTAVMALGLTGYAFTGHSAVAIIACTGVFVLGIMVNGPTMFAHPATFPAAVKARYIGVHQATFGLGMALGPTLGVIAWATLGNGVWLACGVLGLIATWCAWVGVRERSTSSEVSDPS